MHTLDDQAIAPLMKMSDKELVQNAGTTDMAVLVMAKCPAQELKRAAF
jgi:hypothetical protein